MTFFGLPFLAAGVFLLLGTIGVVDIDIRGEEVFVHIIVTVMALAFTVSGATLVFGRKWILLDRGTNEIRTLSGLIVPMRRRATSLGNGAVVSLRHDRGDSDSPDRYPVELKAKGMKTLQLCTSRDYGEARRQAVYVAEFLDIPLEEATTDTVQRLSPDDLGSSLRERLEADTSDDRAVRPFNMRSQVDRFDGELKITAPAEPFRLWKQIPTLIVIGFSLYIYTESTSFLDQAGAPSEAYDFVQLFILVFMIGLPMSSVLRAILKSRLSYSRLTVNRDGIVITERSLVRSKHTRLSLASVQDVDFANSQSVRKAMRRSAEAEALKRRAGDGVPQTLPPMLEMTLSWVSQFVPSKGIVIKTDQRLFSFGASLPDDEVVYLAHVLREWLREH